MMSVAGLTSCLLGLVGCGEDNEAAIRAQADKSTGLVNPSKTVPESRTQADFFKNNPGSNPGASGASKTAPAARTAPAAKTTTPAPKQ
jgi:hypothetical protein